ncbi:hypothetical protein QNZ85_004749 [Vibrio parahaemolyticus]|nr:hypothetical protein [Vibrio parahaemolyticus]
MDNWKDALEEILPVVVSDLERLFKMEPILFGEAQPPRKPGVYIIYDHSGKLAYVGEAKGSGGLRDRFLSKHLSGDDSHAIQRAYKSDFPERLERRDFIKQNVSVRWVDTLDANMALVVERLLILMYQPPWNRK